MNCVPPNSALTLNVTEFRERALREVIKVNETIRVGP